MYLFVRRQVADVHEAQDLTQAFFTQLLEKNLLAVAQPARGRFRSFLLTSVQTQAHWLLGRQPLAKLDTVYPIVWTQILNEKLSGLPVGKQ